MSNTQTPARATIRATETLYLATVICASCGARLDPDAARRGEEDWGCADRAACAGRAMMLGRPAPAPTRLEEARRGDAARSRAAHARRKATDPDFPAREAARIRASRQRQRQQQRPFRGRGEGAE